MLVWLKQSTALCVGVEVCVENTRKSIHELVYKIITEEVHIITILYMY